MNKYGYVSLEGITGDYCNAYLKNGVTHVSDPQGVLLRKIKGVCWSNKESRYNIKGIDFLPITPKALLFELGLTKEEEYTQNRVLAYLFCNVCNLAKRIFDVKLGVTLLDGVTINMPDFDIPIPPQPKLTGKRIRCFVNYFTLLRRLSNSLFPTSAPKSANDYNKNMFNLAKIDKNIYVTNSYIESHNPKIVELKQSSAIKVKEFFPQGLLTFLGNNWDDMCLSSMIVSLATLQLLSQNTVVKTIINSFMLELPFDGIIKNPGEMLVKADVKQIFENHCLTDMSNITPFKYTKSVLGGLYASCNYDALLKIDNICFQQDPEKYLHIE